MSLPIPELPPLDPFNLLDPGEPGWAEALRRNYPPRLDRKGWNLACSIIDLSATDYAKGLLEAYRIVYGAHMDLSDPEGIVEAVATVQADKEHYERYYLNPQDEDTELEMYHRQTVACRHLKEDNAVEQAAAYRKRSEHLVRELRYGIDPDGKRWTYRSLAAAIGLTHSNVQDAVRAVGDQVRGYPVVLTALDAAKYVPPRAERPEYHVNPDGLDITNPAVASLEAWQRPESAEFIAAHQGEGVLIMAMFGFGGRVGTIDTVEIELMRHEYRAIRTEARRVLSER